MIDDKSIPKFVKYTLARPNIPIWLKSLVKILYLKYREYLKMSKYSEKHNVSPEQKKKYWKEKLEKKIRLSKKRRDKKPKK